MTSASSTGKNATQPSAQVRAYLATLPADSRRHILKLRALIREAAPGAADAFGYGMPAFGLDGKPFIWYAAWKQHSSLYPLTRATAQALASQLKGYETSGKGTVRFPLDEPPPSALVKRLVKARLAEVRLRKRRPAR